MMELKTFVGVTSLNENEEANYPFHRPFLSPERESTLKLTENNLELTRTLEIQSGFPIDIDKIPANGIIETENEDCEFDLKDCC